MRGHISRRGIDDFYARNLENPSAKICAFFGIESRKLADILWYVSIGAVIGAYVRYILFEDFSWFSIIALVWVPLLYSERRKMLFVMDVCKTVEESVSSGSIIAPLYSSDIPPQFRDLFGTRAKRMSLGIFFILFGLLPVDNEPWRITASAVRISWFGIFCLISSWSYYCATMFHPGGKSAWSRAKDKVKSLFTIRVAAPVGA